METNGVDLTHVILKKEVMALRDKLNELGAFYGDELTDDAINSANVQTLKGWKRDFDRLVRTLSAGVGR